MLGFGPIPEEANCRVTPDGLRYLLLFEMLKVIMDSSFSTLPWVAHLVGKTYQESQAESYRLSHHRNQWVGGYRNCRSPFRLNVGVRSDLENYPLDWRHQLETHANYMDAIHGFY